MNERDALVFQTTDPTELQMARNVLQAAGIPVRVKGGSASSLLGAVMGPMVGGLSEIFVPAELEEKALDVLDDAWTSRDD